MRIQAVRFRNLCIGRLSLEADCLGDLRSNWELSPEADCLGDLRSNWELSPEADRLGDLRSNRSIR